MLSSHEGVNKKEGMHSLGVGGRARGMFHPEQVKVAPSPVSEVGVVFARNTTP